MAGIPQEQARLVAVVGPTASGKSSLALGLAQALPGEIVNCDSMQMVRGLDIGTAKPAARERAAVPHHLYDRVDPDEWYSAGRYMEEGRKICREIAARGRVPVVVGGTGLYLRALLEGVFQGPDRSREHRRSLRRVADGAGPSALHEKLAEVDPVAAGRIAPTDLVRVIRALEVFDRTGRPISELQAEREPLDDFRSVKLGIRLDRKVLHARIHKRVRQMFQDGLVEEVRGLIERGVSPECKGFEAIGYRQVVSFLDQKMSLEEAIESICMETRRYAKRQMTWFRKEPGLCWLEGPGERPEVLPEALRLLA